MSFVNDLHLFLFISSLKIVYAEIELVQNSENVSTANVSSTVDILDYNKVSDVIVTTLEPDFNQTKCGELGSENDVNEVQCNTTNSLQSAKHSSENEVTDVISNTTPEPFNPEAYTRGLFGGYYYNGTNNSHYFAHGKYITPIYEYYGKYEHTLKDQSTLGYYLGYALNKMNQNEYFRHHNFTHFNVHHFYFMNNTMLPELDIGTDNIVLCASNTSAFCPENTEAICLLNTTVWCATKLSFIENCEEDEIRGCVRTRLPCVKFNDVNCHTLGMEFLKLPCISTIKIRDINEDKNKTLFNVAGTFILGPISPIEDRTYCITIVAEPSTDLPLS